MELKDNKEVHAAIFDTGAVGDAKHFWWEDLTPMHPVASDGTVPSYWGYRLTATHPDDVAGEGDMPPVEVEIYQATVAKAMDGILDGRFGEGAQLPEGCKPVSEATVEVCEKLRDDPENGSFVFDSWTADEVLQVVVYGGIVF